VEFGAEVTVGEMALAKRLLDGRSSEFALLRSHADEPFFGAQLADRSPETLAEGARVAEARGARFVDLNCGCPIHAMTGRGLGASLLRKPRRLGRLVEAMRRAVGIPVTVKLRTGWSEGHVNVSEVARVCEESGAAAITVHARTRDQRYSRTADWDVIGRVAAERGVPVVGNGDLLTHYEADERMHRSGVTSVMLGRGALIKPWIFREIREGRTWLPTPEERLSVVWRLVELMREHFGEGPRGKGRILGFLPWHFDFFSRYRPLPEELWGERSRAHPLLQTRLPLPPHPSPLERLLSDPRPETHSALAALLVEADSLPRALEGATGLAAAVPSAPEDADAERSFAEAAG
jgi:tRNA-dihydrouridine synthase 3